ncbi:alkaline phosphatase D family protein [Halegenticoccus tardaugens]|uniref:alkaline phosphatase D family protein n=1 Tax=Halegenticoccus tardaugens TaxID=2071624 RepID=UPI00100BC578|nr:alkaline phosphatase D family protein [Halegenticoccus tardaugens]
MSNTDTTDQQTHETTDTGVLLERRRDVLRKVGGVAVMATVGSSGIAASEKDSSSSFSDYPFTLGVASGDPHPHSVVLWTRLAPKPLAEDGRGGMPDQKVRVIWEVAESETFDKIVDRETVSATPKQAHSVHVTVDGLQPDKKYYYRFLARDAVSRVGRTKTAPLADSQIDELQFGLASCQAWVGGRYASYRNMVEEDLDFVVHVGDYIYEKGDTKTLTDYRLLHALYKTSPDLQAAHAAFPFIVTFDDHEIENNWADEQSQKDGEADQDPQVFLEKRANGFQGYYEHMPLRDSSKPDGPDIDMYRRLSFGDLAEIHVLDTRQYRSDQPCGDWLSANCEERFDASQTMLGSQQEQWLEDGLEESPATWNVLAQQTMMSEYDYDPDEGKVVNVDQWDGYVAARNRLFDVFEQNSGMNPVVISGDWHTNWANNLKADFDDTDSETLATEFLTTSISSGESWADDVEQALSENPHVQFFDGDHNGYLRFTVTPEKWQTDFRVVANGNKSKYETRDDPNADVTTLATFVVEEGEPGAKQIEN